MNDAAQTVAQTVAETAGATVQTMLPMLLQAAQAAAGASNPQIAVAIFAASMLGAVVKAQQSTPSDIQALYAALGPLIGAEQAQIDAAIKARVGS